MPTMPPEGRVGQHDYAARIDDQQAFGQRIQCGAHPAQDRGRRVRLLSTRAR